MRILSLIQEDDWSVDELVQTVQADPALTGRLIRLANSTSSGAAEKIATVHQAAMRLGARSVASITLGFTLISANKSGRCGAFRYEEYWSNTLARAVAARVLCQLTGLGDPSQAFTCALLCRVGALALASVHPIAYASILDRCRENPDLDLLSLESEQFEIEHHEVSRAMLIDWGMPSVLCDAVGMFAYGDAIERTTDPKTHELIRILRWARVMGELFTCAAEQRVRHWSEMEAVAREIDLESDDFVQLCDGVGEEWHKWGEILGVATSELISASQVRGAARDAEPATQVRVSEASTAEAAPPESRRLRALAADDDATSLLALSHVLSSMDCDVVTARDGREALSLVLERGVQLIVSDWMMPEKDGLELCRTLRQSPMGRGIYFILLTGQDSEDEIVKAFDAGIDDYVVKPFKRRLLAARVRAGRRMIELQEEVEREKRTQRKKTAELALMARRLHEAALTDSLTEIPNRRFALQRLGDEWQIWKRKRRPLSIVAIDIDHFKSVNDSYGHDIGDLVLKRTATAMMDMTRQTEVLARMGGEEFLLICPDSSLAEAAISAERFRRAVEENQIQQPSFQGGVTISLGVAEAVDATPDLDALLKMADLAVYQAKNDGRNRVCRAESGPFQDAMGPSAIHSAMSPRRTRARS